jgi:hypothetical protein
VDGLLQPASSYRAFFAPGRPLTLSRGWWRRHRRSRDHRAPDAVDGGSREHRAPDAVHRGSGGGWRTGAAYLRCSRKLGGYRAGSKLKGPQARAGSQRTRRGRTGSRASKKAFQHIAVAASVAVAAALGFAAGRAGTTACGAWEPTGPRERDNATSLVFGRVAPPVRSPADLGSSGTGASKSR